MNNKQRAEEMLKQAEAMIAEAKVMLAEKPKADILWKPEEGDLFYILGTNSVCAIWWNDSVLNKQIYESQELSKTNDEAYLADRRRKAGMKVKRRIAELNDGWVPDFSGLGSYKHFLYYSHTDEQVFVGYVDAFRQTMPTEEYCRSDEIAEQIISELGTEWKLWKGIGV